MDHPPMSSSDAATGARNATAWLGSRVNAPWTKAGNSEQNGKAYVAAIQTTDASSRRSFPAHPSSDPYGDSPPRNPLRKQNVPLYVLVGAFEFSLVMETVAIVLGAVHAHQNGESGGVKAAVIILGAWGAVGMIGTALGGWMVWQARKKQMRFRDAQTEEMQETRAQRSQARNDEKDLAHAALYDQRHMSEVSRSPSRGRPIKRFDEIEDGDLGLRKIPSFRPLTPSPPMTTARKRISYVSSVTDKEDTMHDKSDAKKDVKKSTWPHHLAVKDTPSSIGLLQEATVTNVSEAGELDEATRELSIIPSDGGTSVFQPMSAYSTEVHPPFSPGAHYSMRLPDDAFEQLARFYRLEDQANRDSEHVTEDEPLCSKPTKSTKQPSHEDLNPLPKNLMAILDKPKNKGGQDALIKGPTRVKVPASESSTIRLTELENANPTDGPATTEDRTLAPVGSQSPNSMDVHPLHRVISPKVQDITPAPGHSRSTSHQTYHRTPYPSHKDILDLWGKASSTTVQGKSQALSKSSTFPRMHRPPPAKALPPLPATMMEDLVSNGNDILSKFPVPPKSPTSPTSTIDHRRNLPSEKHFTDRARSANKLGKSSTLPDLHSPAPEAVSTKHISRSASNIHKPLPPEPPSYSTIGSPHPSRSGTPDGPLSNGKDTVHGAAPPSKSKILESDDERPAPALARRNEENEFPPKAEKESLSAREKFQGPEARTEPTAGKKSEILPRTTSKSFHRPPRDRSNNGAVQSRESEASFMDHLHEVAGPTGLTSAPSSPKVQHQRHMQALLDLQTPGHEVNVNENAADSLRDANLHASDIKTGGTIDHEPFPGKPTEDRKSASHDNDDKNQNQSIESKNPNTPPLGSNQANTVSPNPVSSTGANNPSHTTTVTSETDPEIITTRYSHLATSLNAPLNPSIISSSNTTTHPQTHHHHRGTSSLGSAVCASGMSPQSAAARNRRLRVSERLRRAAEMIRERERARERA